MPALIKLPKLTVALMIAMAAAATCVARADGPPAAPKPTPPNPASGPRWPGPIDGNRAPLLVLDLGARLVACPGGTVEASEIDIGGLRYELTEACRGTGQRGHIEISGIAGQDTAASREGHTAEPGHGDNSAQQQRPGEPEHKNDSAPRPITRCDPATWNCTPAKR